jgi:hypothetical protein
MILLPKNIVINKAVKLRIVATIVFTHPVAATAAASDSATVTIDVPSNMFL